MALDTATRPVSKLGVRWDFTGLSDTALAEEIHETAQEITSLENTGDYINQKAADDRKRYTEFYEARIRSLDDTEKDYSNKAEKARKIGILLRDSPELLTDQDIEVMAELPKLKSAASLKAEKDSMETLLAWTPFDTSGSNIDRAIAWLSPSKETLTVALAYPMRLQQKEGSNSPDYWFDLVEDYYDEASNASILKNTIGTQLDAVRGTSIEKFVSPDKPFAFESVYLEDKLLALGQERSSRETGEEIADETEGKTTEQAAREAAERQQLAQEQQQQQTGQGQDLSARRQAMIERYTQMMLSRFPGITEDEARQKATLFTDKILARRAEMIEKWITKIMGNNSAITREIALAQAEKIVDLQIKQDEEEAMGKYGNNTAPDRSVDNKIAVRQSPHEAPQTKDITPRETKAGKVIQEMQQRAIEVGPVYSFRNYIQHPTLIINRLSNGLRNYWQKAFGGATKETSKALTSGASKKLLKEGTKKVATETGKKVLRGTALKAALAAVPAGITQVAAVILTAKDIISSLIPKELKEKLKDLWTYVKIGMGAVALWLLLNPGAAIGGIIGSMMGGAIAPLLGPLAPLAPVAGFTVGAIVGYFVQGIISSIFSGGGATAGVTTATTASTSATVEAGVGSISIGGFSFSGLSSAVSGAWSFLTGTGISSGATIALGTTAVVTVTTVLIAVGVIASSTPAEEPIESQGSDVIFEVKNTVAPDLISDYEEAETQIVYTILITAKQKDIEILNIDNTATATSQIKTIKNLKPVLQDQTLTEVKAGFNTSIKYILTISGPDYKDSRLVDLVKVTARNKGETQAQTLNDSSLVIIGNPPSDSHPYGFPIAGQIRTVDDEMVPATATNLAHHHCGQVYPNKTTCVRGGIDIAAVGDVKATLNGKVKYSWFNQDMGGVVIVVSDTEEYYVAFMHLKNENRAQVGTTVQRGNKIGEIYTDYTNNPLKYSSGRHVHYQVLRNGANVNFADGKNVGECIDATNQNRKNITPWVVINPSNVPEGPFVCD